MERHAAGRKFELKLVSRGPPDFLRDAIPSPDPIQHNIPLTLSEKILLVFTLQGHEQGMVVRY
jgi:hypothetical protein